jgi:CheY-like chemotaxis protein
VLDDDVGIRAVVREALEPEFSVFEARDAEEALRACRLAAPSIILVDLLLPGGMSGQQFITRYRRDGGRAKLVLFTGNPAADQIAREVKADGVIKKPFDVEKLAPELRALGTQG